MGISSLGCYLMLVSMLSSLAAQATGSSKLSLASSSSPGSFEIQINHVSWFRSGNISVTVEGKTYSTSDRSLKARGAETTGSGSDSLGVFTSKTQTWMAGTTPYMTSTRLYASKFVVFEQSYPAGAAGTNITLPLSQTSSPQGEVSSCFPSIDTQPAVDQPLGYVWWGGRAFLEGSQGGVWRSGGRGSPGVGTGNGGGPFVVFGEEMTDSLVFSPASNYMTNTLGNAPSPGWSESAAQSRTTQSSSEERSFCFGLDAPVESVPPGYVGV